LRDNTISNILPDTPQTIANSVFSPSFRHRIRRQHSIVSEGTAGYFSTTSSLGSPSMGGQDDNNNEGLRTNTEHGADDDVGSGKCHSASDVVVTVSSRECVCVHTSTHTQSAYGDPETEREHPVPLPLHSASGSSHSLSEEMPGIAASQHRTIMVTDDGRQINEPHSATDTDTASPSHEVSVNNANWKLQLSTCFNYRCMFILNR
jgi:hypothetical protein